MDVRAVFFDLDGTLFTTTRNILPSTKSAILALRQQGILVGIATGRGPSFVKSLMEDLKLDFAITYNGQYIFTPKEVIRKVPIDKTSLREILSYSISNHREVSFGGENGMSGSSLIKFGETRTAQFANHLLPKGFSSGVKGTFQNFIRRLIPQQGDLNRLIEEPIYQVVMVATKNETQKLKERFPNVSFTRSNPYSVDIVAKGASKVEGIKLLGARYSFGLEHVMAFGDNDNDIKMIREVGCGIAMGNSSSRVKDVAAYVTSSNNQDGIVKALKHFGLLKTDSNNPFKSRDRNFEKVKEFHQLMDGRLQELPKNLSKEEASHRVDFQVEELVELLYAASKGQTEDFTDLVQKMKEDVDKAYNKVISKKKDVSDTMTNEVDALIDSLYLTYGSFVLMGIDPAEIFDLVHQANMGKVFPDGKAHFDPVTHKILKPDNWERDYAPESRMEKELEGQILRGFNRKSLSE
ncbi:Cof-type HAD-IIB family hydrolase [Streptococcaceae bacterium ESL0729]|nr:Cof-type HAD-IIB family hydrolase [Streptococcaceae bacterium ESL0729]